MPITEKGFEYTLPEEWKARINDQEFLETFRNELFKVKNLALNDFYLDVLGYLEGSSGWNVSFFYACMATGREDIYKYSRTLDSYEHDFFCEQIDQLLIHHKLVLPGSLFNFLCQSLNLQSEDIDYCGKCAKVFFKEDIAFTKYNNEDNDGYFLCHKCHSENDMSYYQEGLKKIEAYQKESL